MNDVKFVFRLLLKNPRFTAVAVITLALGIGQRLHGETSRALSEKQTAADFEDFSHFVRTNYCYFETRPTDWNAVSKLYKSHATAARTVGELASILEVRWTSYMTRTANWTQTGTTRF